MPNTNKESKPGHLTTGDILDDLGLSPQEALEAKVKFDLWQDLLVHIERKRFDQAHLKTTLKIHQPDVSNLLRGKISKFSTGKLIQFAVRLSLDVHVQLKEPRARKRLPPTTSKAKTTKRHRKLACA